MTKREARTFWWQKLRNLADNPLPFSVQERISWYERQVQRHRVGNYALESAIVVVAAAIPAAVALGASGPATGVLGATVSILAGIRQLVRPGENWIRFSATLVGLHREAVVWSAGGHPYSGDHADLTLIENVETLVAQETTRWSEQRSGQLPGENPPQQAPA